jgi:hypothetical protein
MGTLKANNGENAKTGNVEVQPSEPSVKTLAQQSANSGKDTPPPSEQPLNERFSGTSEGSARQNNPSVTDLAKSVSDPDTIIPTLRGTGANQIMPSNSKLELDKLDEVRDIYLASKRIDAYEQFTGISRERPEIVMLTNFQPLYARAEGTNEAQAKYSYRPMRPTLTAAGRFFEQQVQIRDLRVHNMKHMMSLNKKSSPGFRKITATRKDKFQSEVESLSSTAGYLLTLIKIIETYKQQLDVRGELSTVTPDEVLKVHLNKVSPVRAQSILRYLTSALHTNFLSKYDVHHVMELFGFDATKSKSSYTSTKIWLQLMYELKSALTTHTLSLLDITSAQQKNDDNPTKILRAQGIKKFHYSSSKPDSVLSFSSLKDVSVDDLGDVVRSTMSAFSQIYESVNFRNQEMRIAGLINMISQEYRYSKGLGNNDVQAALSKNYNYNVTATNNLGVFDHIIGQFGDSIEDALSPSGQSLTSIAQASLDTNDTVLSLEPRYIEGDKGTLIPGSEYYAGSLLNISGGKYDTARLQEFLSKLSGADRAFNTIVNGMNLLSSGYVDDSSPDSNSFSTKLSNAGLLFQTIRKSFIGEDGTPIAVLSRDPLTPVFAMAHSDTKIRSYLFLYIIMRISRAYHTDLPSFRSNFTNDNTPTSEEIIKLLVEELVTKSKLTSPSFSYDSTLIKKEAISEALRSSSLLLRSVEDLFKQIILAFKADCLTLDATRYGGNLDTVIMMTLFDVISSMVGVYGNKQITGLQTDGGQQAFIVQSNFDNHFSAMREIDGRLTKEIVLAQHVIFFSLSVINRLQNSTRNIINYVSRPQSVEELNKISTLLDGDTELLKLVFSEQQIRLFANTVADLTAALSPSNQGSGFSFEDVDSDGDFDADDEIKCLDDSVITPKVRDAIEVVLSSAPFVDKKASDYKIMTVGVPVGFIDNLRLKVDSTKIKNTSPRQGDVAKIKVYKVDLLNPDIIYKPQEFLFEMSRFIARPDELIKPVEAQAATLLDIMKKFPTRDYSQTLVEGGTTVQYLQAQKDEIEALSGADYAFLSQKEKNSLFFNHVMSHLLEVYIKVMTGVTTAEHHFDIVPPTPYMDKATIENIVNNHVSNFVAARRVSQTSTGDQAQGGLLFAGSSQRSKKKSKDSLRDGASNNSGQTPFDGYTDSSGTAGLSPSSALAQFKNNKPVERAPSVSPDQTLDQNLAQLSQENIPAIAHQLGVINEFARALTPQSDPVSVSKRLMKPKQFDRTFNILLDPHSFEINVDSINRTPHGKETLDFLISKGDVVASKKPTALNQGAKFSTKRFENRERCTSQGDIMFEKYFVAIETFDGEED